MPQIKKLNITRAQRRVGTPEQRIFDPGPADTSVEDAIARFGGAITSAATDIGDVIEAKRDRDDQANINDALIEYAKRTGQIQNDILANEELDSKDGIDQYVLNAQGEIEKISDKLNLNDRTRKAFSDKTVPDVLSGINNLSLAYQQRGNNKIVSNISEEENLAIQSVSTNPTPENLQKNIDKVVDMIDASIQNPLTRAAIYTNNGVDPVEFKEGVVRAIQEKYVLGLIQQDAEGTLEDIEAGDLNDLFKDAKTKQLYEDEARRQIAVNKRDQKIAKAEAQRVEGERIYDTFSQGQLTLTEIDNSILPTNEKLAWRARLKAASGTNAQKFIKSDPEVYSQVYISLTTDGLVPPLTDDDIIAFMGKGLSVQDVDHFRALLAESMKPEFVQTKKADTIALGLLKEAFEAGEFGDGLQGTLEYTRQVRDFEKWRANDPGGDSAKYVADIFKKTDKTLMDKLFGGDPDPIMSRIERNLGITFDSFLAAAREQDPDIDAEELREAFIQEFQ